MASSSLVLIDHPDCLTAERCGERITVPYWIGELVNCGIKGDDRRMSELYREHVKGPADLERVIAFAGIVTGLSGAQVSETLEDVVRRHTH